MGRATRIDFEVEPGAREGTCKACGAPLLWQVTATRADGSPQWHPLDVRSEVTDLVGVRRMESHFARCPEADRFRRRRRGG